MISRISASETVVSLHSGRYYAVLAAILVLLVIWIALFIRVVTSDDGKNSLSRQYGEGGEESSRKKRDIGVLIVTGVIIAVIVGVYVLIGV